MRRNDIIRFAELTIQKFQTNDPFIICDHLNIGLTIKYLGTSQGYYGYSNGMSEIFINKTFDYETQRAVCAHELGHALLHTDVNVKFMTECTFFSENKYEREANTFAAALLLHGIKDMTHEYSDYSYREIALVEGVPDDFVKLMFGVE